jgi:hypothetical protein
LTEQRWTGRSTTAVASASQPVNDDYGAVAEDSSPIRYSAVRQSARVNMARKAGSMM